MPLSKIQFGNTGRRNILANGAMLVSQRGTSFASVGNVYTLDRFAFYKQNSGAAFTITQSSVTDLAGFANALKVDCTTADTSLAANEQAYISHKIEGQDLQRFQKGHSTALGFTLSFYVKTTKTGLYPVTMFDRDNTRKGNASYTVANTSWNRYIINFPADTTGKFDDDNASSLEIFFNLYAGADTNTGTLSTAWAASADAGSTTGQVNFADNTSNDWEITGIQLEPGSTATEFEQRSFAEELEHCQRYYFRIVGDDIDGGKYASHYRKRSGNGYFYSDTAVLSRFNFPVPMRISPTALEQSGTDSDYDFVYRNTTSVPSGSVIIYNDATQYGGTTYQVSHTDNNAQGEAGQQRIRTNAGFLGWSAEL